MFDFKHDNVFKHYNRPNTPLLRIPNWPIRLFVLITQHNDFKTPRLRVYNRVYNLKGILPREPLHCGLLTWY